MGLLDGDSPAGRLGSLEAQSPSSVLLGWSHG